MRWLVLALRLTLHSSLACCCTCESSSPAQSAGHRRGALAARIRGFCMCSFFSLVVARRAYMNSLMPQCRIARPWYNKKKRRISVCANGKISIMSKEWKTRKRNFKANPEVKFCVANGH